VFSSDSVAGLEGELNAWFAKNPYKDSSGYRGSGVTKINHTHDKTLYFPFGII